MTIVPTQQLTAPLHTTAPPLLAAAHEGTAPARSVRLPGSAPSPSAPALTRGERGMISAEWAVGLIAAVSIAGVLIAVITSPAIREALLAVVLRIINFISGITIPG